MLRKTVVILALVCLSALVGLAGDKSGKPSAAEHAAKLQAELNLTAEQTAAVEQVFAEFIPKFEAFRARMKAGMEEAKAKHGDTKANAEASEAKHGEMEAMHADRNALVEARRAQMQQILNDEQYKKFVEMEASHMKQKGAGGHKGSHGEKQGGHPN